MKCIYHEGMWIVDYLCSFRFRFRITNNRLSFRTEFLGSAVLTPCPQQSCLEALNIDLHPGEMRRVFGFLDQADSGKISFQEFCQGVMNRQFLKNLLSHVVVRHEMHNAYVVPDDYDYSQSTEENYKDDDIVTSDLVDVNAKFHGEFWVYRKKLDYSYHVHYRKSRQEWQDELISLVVTKTKPQHRPWLGRSDGLWDLLLW